MAQAGYTPILIYGSGTASAVPTNTNLTSSANGAELALNYNDGKLYYKDSGGVVQLLASKAGASGSVTTVSVVSANGLAGTVANATTTPAITLSTSITGVLKGNGTAISAAVSGTDYAPATSGTSILKGNGAGGFSNAASGTDYAPATSGTSILYGNGAGGFSNVAIGSGISFAGGTLTATGTGGSVTSVAMTVPAFLSVAGSPITSSGTLAVSYSGTALPVANGGTGATTLTANNVILGNGTSAVQFVAPSTAGNVLTSNGTTWASTAPAASGGSVTGTASGSISSGSPVLVNTNGTFSAPTVATGATSVGTITSVVGTGYNYFSLVYCTSPGVYVLFYNSNSTSYLCGRIGTPSGGSVTWGSEIVLGSNAGNAHVSAVYLSNIPGTCAVWFGLGGGGFGYIYAVSVTASTLTAGSPVSVQRSDNYGGIAWNPTNSIGMVVGINGSTARGFNAAFTVAGTTVTAGSPVETAGIFYEPNIEYDPNSGYFLNACRGNSNDICILPATTTSGRVTTQYTITTVYNTASTASGTYGMVYVPGPNKMLITGCSNYNSVVYVYITMTGSTPSAASSFLDTSSGGSNSRGLSLDATNGAVASLYRNTSGFATVKCMAVSGTTISLSSATTLTPGYSATPVVGYTGKFPYDVVNGYVNAYWYYSSTIQQVTFKAASSTLTAENFIGFSSASYTTGQTATVTCVGGKSTTVSGVAVGARNYVSGTSLTTTNTGIYAGIGLSSTSILVRA